MRKLIILGVALAIAGCTDPPAARRALTQAGYTQVTAGGYAFAACGDRDTFATRFQAVGPTGVPVTGAVCSGWLKGHTIRLD